MANVQTRHHSAWALRWIVTLTMLIPVNVPAQVREVAPCNGDCRIRINLITTLGDTTGTASGFVGRPASIARRSNGNFLLADRHDQERLKRFSPRGEYLGHVGRRGQGPGEFQVIQFIHTLAGDSIETIDIGQARLTVFTPEWEPVRTLRLYGGMGAWETVRLPDGSRVMAGLVCRPECLGLPLHHVGRDGQIASSFGAAPPVDPRDEGALYRQLTSGSSPMSVWSAWLPRYRLEEWTVSGNLLRAFERRANWFPPGTGRAGFSRPDEPPQPRIMAIYRDTADVLWILIRIADAKWREGIGELKDPYGGTYRGPRDRNRYEDTVIEAIHISTAALLGTVRLDEAAQGFTEDGHVFGYKEASNGEPYIPIWSVRVPPRS